MIEIKFELYVNATGKDFQVNPRGAVAQILNQTARNIFLKEGDDMHILDKDNKIIGHYNYIEKGF